MSKSIAVFVVVAFLLAVGSASASDPPYGPVVVEKINATHTCQTLLGVPHTQERYPWRPHSAGYWRAELNLWKRNHARCLKRLHLRGQALRTGNYSILPTGEVYALAQQAIEHGGIYSLRWGDASPILRGLCYEAVSRAFGSNAAWARHIVNRESGCNPAATNTTYSSWSQQAKCIAQMIPAYHSWVDYSRCQRDLRYAVQVFVRLSRGGSSTGPWG